MCRRSRRRHGNSDVTRLWPTLRIRSASGGTSGGAVPGCSRLDPGFRRVFTIRTRPSSRRSAGLFLRLSGADVGPGRRTGPRTGDAVTADPARSGPTRPGSRSQGLVASGPCRGGASRSETGAVTRAPDRRTVRALLSRRTSVAWTGAPVLQPSVGNSRARSGSKSKPILSPGA